MMLISNKRLQLAGLSFAGSCSVQCWEIYIIGGGGGGRAVNDVILRAAAT